jgi:hypothetical protein
LPEKNALATMVIAPIAGAQFLVWIAFRKFPKRQFALGYTIYGEFCSRPVFAIQTVGVETGFIARQQGEATCTEQEAALE